MNKSAAQTQRERRERLRSRGFARLDIWLEPQARAAVARLAAYRGVTLNEAVRGAIASADRYLADGMDHNQLRAYKDSAANF